MSTLATAGRNAAAAAVGALLNSGYLKFYDSGDVLLGTVALPSTAFGDPATGVVTANAISSVSVSTSGTPASVKAYQSDGTTLVWTGTVTATSDGGDITFDNVSWEEGNTVAISGFTFTQNT